MLRLLVLTVLADIAAAQVTIGGRTFFCQRSEVRDCSFTGYAPGGNVSDVGAIEAPTASLHSAAMNDIFNRGSQISGLAGAAAAVADVTSSIAPYMGPVIGIFAAVTSIATGETTPTPDDIINAVNDAIGELTYEMNNRLEKMKGYVDTQIISTHESLLRDDYKEMWRGWLMCARKPNKADSDSCQSREFEDIYSNIDRFTKYAGELKRGRTLTGMQYREIEAKLPSTRDYANLLLMVLKALVDNYKNQQEGDGAGYYKLYSEYMESSATTFVEYANKSVDAIMSYHAGSDGTGDCTKTLDCGGAHSLKEGYWNTHTADWARCTCTIDDGTKTICNIKTFVRFDRQTCDNNANWRFGSSLTIRSVPTWATHATKADIKNRAKRFVEAELQVMEGYWQKTLLSFVGPWEQAIEYAKPGVATKVDKKIMDSVRRKSRKHH